MADIPGGGIISDLNVTRYRVTRCCNASETALFVISDTFIPELLPNETAVYRRLGLSSTITVDGVTFESGYCYTIENLGQGAPVLNTISWTDFEGTDVNLGCQDAKCAPCEDPDPLIPFKLIWTPCCDAFDVIETKGDNYQDYLGVIAPLAVTQASFPIGLMLNECYHVTVEATSIEIYNSLPTPVPFIYNGPNATGNSYVPVVTDPDIVDPCSDPTALTLCPECPVNCFRVVNCEGTQDFLVVSNIDTYGVQDISNFVNQFVTLVDENGAMASTFYVLETNEPCTNAVSFISVDPVLPTPCDCLCTEVIFNPTLPAIGTPSPILDSTDKFDKQYIEKAAWQQNYDLIIGIDIGDVKDPNEVTTGSKGFTYVDCDGEVQYIFGNSIICSSIYPVVTSPAYSTLYGNVIINQSGPCIDGECAVDCYALVNCQTKEIIYSIQETLFTYYQLDQTVTLDGYEGCWEVVNGDCSCLLVQVDGTLTLTANWEGDLYNDEKLYKVLIPSSPGGTPDLEYAIWFSGGNWAITTVATIGSITLNGTFATISGLGKCPVSNTWTPGKYSDLSDVTSVITEENESCAEGCDSCPVNVNVLTIFDSCADCIGVIAYRLQGCDNPADIKYTTSDLSQHVDRVIEIDCGCYIVDLITYRPPTDIPITVLYSFDDCIKCKTKYFKLTDCSDGTLILYTDTDLTSYISQVVKITNCDNCWQVEATREPGIIETVTLDSSYINCPECLTSSDICEGVVITNVSDDATTTVEYYDCNSEFVSYKLVPGATTGKICVNYVVQSDAYTSEPPVLYLEKYGDCQQGVFPQPVFKNNRTVRPGYNTPICSAAKYDKITCNFADVMYKDALEKRYGISNCCPEDDQKWIVSKLLIDMQALKDINFPSSGTPCKCEN